MLSGQQVATIRKQRGWSQQYLAIQSGVNKAYISEFESGVRSSLPERMTRQLEEVLLAPPAGRIRARIENIQGKQRLVLYDRDGNKYMPKVASVQWVEEDDTTYSIYLGDPQS